MHPVCVRKLSQRVWAAGSRVRSLEPTPGVSCSRVGGPPAHLTSTSISGLAVRAPWASRAYHLWQPQGHEMVVDHEDTTALAPSRATGATSPGIPSMFPVWWTMRSLTRCVPFTCRAATGGVHTKMLTETILLARRCIPGPAGRCVRARLQLRPGLLRQRAS